MIRKEKRPIHVPASYRLAVREFVLVLAFFKSETLLFISASSFSLTFLYPVYHLFVKNIKGDGRGLKKEGAYSLSSPEKEGGLFEGADI